MANSAGGCFLPNESYNMTGGSFSNVTLTSPTISGATLTTTTLTSPTLTSPTITGPSISGVTSAANTITGTTASTTRYVQSAVTITPASTFSVTGGGSIAGVRGDITLSASKTFTDGFLYGVQGKFTLNGTMNETSAARICGVLGQVDLASGTVTDGQVSAVWADMQATSPTLTDPSQINVLRVTNSTSSTLNAMAFFYGQSSYLFTCGRDGGDPTYFGTAAPSSLAKSLKVKIGSTDYYIGLYSSAS